MDIAKALKLYDQQNLVSETLPDSVGVYRIRVLTAMLKSGVPISKIDCFRELLEGNAPLVCPTCDNCCHLCLNRRLEKLKQLFVGGLSQLYLMIPHMCGWQSRYLTCLQAYTSGQVIEWRRSSQTNH